MRSSVISMKGWVVIPKNIREKYKLKGGDRVDIVDYGGIISIIPISDDPIKETAGMLKNGTSLTEALLSERKKERELGK
jgi:AbrB family looped-hinge helix DNA binding protein